MTRAGTAHNLRTKVVTPHIDGSIVCNAFATLGPTHMSRMLNAWSACVWRWRCALCECLALVLRPLRISGALPAFTSMRRARRRYLSMLKIFRRTTAHNDESKSVHLARSTSERRVSATSQRKTTHCPKLLLFCALAVRRVAVTGPLRRSFRLPKCGCGVM